MGRPALIRGAGRQQDESATGPLDVRGARRGRGRQNKMQSTQTGQAGTQDADSNAQGLGMKDIAELERRISAALARIGDGLAALPAATPAAAPVAEDSAELAALRAELATERAARAALQAQLEAATATTATASTTAVDSARVISLQEQVDRLTKLLDVQGLDLVRLRKTVGTLRESLQSLRSAQVATLPDTAAINRALLAEVDAMRAERQSEMAELDEIIAELDPLVPPMADADTAGEGRDNG